MRKIVTISDRYQEQLREATKSMQHMARTDPLTNLSNRRDMLECLDREVERFVRYEKDFSIIMFDIDDFKSVNDSYGHDAGDRVLKGLALVFLETLRRADVCSRWGGEEFLVLCPETTSESARTVGEKCLLAVSAMRVATEAGPIGITLSGGVAAMQKGFDRDDLIKLADAKLYAAKAAGKKRIVD
jgi:diguanylate cyclase (GGDEF)-like protein